MMTPPTHTAGTGVRGRLSLRRSHRTRKQKRIEMRSDSLGLSHLLQLGRGRNIGATLQA